MTPYAERALAIEPVTPTGHSTVLLMCLCGRCPGLHAHRYPIPPADAATASRAFRTYRFALGLPRSLAADRLGISREQLLDLESGLARCNWGAARAALRWRRRAEA